MLRIIVTENYIFYVCGGLEDSVVLVFLLLEFVVFMLLQVVFVASCPKGLTLVLLLAFVLKLILGPLQILQ